MEWSSTMLATARTWTSLPERFRAELPGQLSLS